MINFPATIINLHFECSHFLFRGFSLCFDKIHIIIVDVGQMDQEKSSTLQPTGYSYRDDDLGIDHKITIFRIMMMRTENLVL